MERKFYKTPRTKLFSVELEGTFAGSAEVQNPDTETGRIEHQAIDNNFGATYSFGDAGWDEETTTN